MDHKMVVRADARAMSATTALTVRVTAPFTGSKADSRRFNGRKFTGNSACISYDANGNARVFAPSKDAAHKRTKDTIAIDNARNARYNRFNERIG